MPVCFFSFPAAEILQGFMLQNLLFDCCSRKDGKLIYICKFKMALEQKSGVNIITCRSRFSAGFYGCRLLPQQSILHSAMQRRQQADHWLLKLNTPFGLSGF